jgi:hypothetical protein
VVAQTGQTGQRFYDASNEALSVVAVRVSNPDFSSVGIHR